jgi:hypothetical protein
MEPPRKRAKISHETISTKLQWNPCEWAFLMGTHAMNQDSSIRKAFGQPVWHPLSERQLIKLILRYQQWPEELRKYKAPAGYDKDEEGRKLPQIQEDGRALVLYKKEFNFEDYAPDEEDWNYDKIGYKSTEVFYDPDLNSYEILKIDIKFNEITSQFGGDGFGDDFPTLSDVLKRLKLDEL